MSAPADLFKIMCKRPGCNSTNGEIKWRRVRIVVSVDIASTAFFFFFLIKNYYCKRQEPELIDLLSLLLQLRKVQEVSCQSLRPSQAKEFQFQSTRDWSLETKDHQTLIIPDCCWSCEVGRKQCLFLRASECNSESCTQLILWVKGKMIWGNSDMDEQSI